MHACTRTLIDQRKLEWTCWPVLKHHIARECICIDTSTHRSQYQLFHARIRVCTHVSQTISSVHTCSRSIARRLTANSSPRMLAWEPQFQTLTVHPPSAQMLVAHTVLQTCGAKGSWMARVLAVNPGPRALVLTHMVQQKSWWAQRRWNR